MISLFLCFSCSITKDINFWEAMELKQQIFENDEIDYNIQITKTPFLFLIPTSAGARAVSYDYDGKKVGNLLQETDGTPNNNYLAYYNISRGFVALKQSGELNQAITFNGLDLYSVDENLNCQTIKVLNKESATINSATDGLLYTNPGTRCLWLVSPEKTTFTITNANNVALTVYSSRGPASSETSPNYEPELHTVGADGLTVETTNIFVKWQSTASSNPEVQITRPAITTTNYITNINIQINPFNTYSAAVFENDHSEDESTVPTPPGPDESSSSEPTEPSSSEASESPSESPSGLSIGALVGIIVGSVIGFIILVGAIVFIALFCCCD